MTNMTAHDRRHLRISGAYRNWKGCCVKLHNADPGVGLWYRGRLNIFCGLTMFETPSGKTKIGPMWWGCCCSCGDEFHRCSVGADAASTLRPDGFAPTFNVAQRCPDCRDKTLPTPLGYEPAALKRMRDRGRDVSRIHRPERHYLLWYFDNTDTTGVNRSPRRIQTSEFSEHRRLTILTSLL